MAGPGARKAAPESPRLRLDKWLWQARFFRSRSLAAGVIEGGDLRVNGQRLSRPGASITVGDVLTFVQGNAVRVVRVRALGHRRGPAAEAQLLYADLSPPTGPEDGASWLLE